MIKLIFKLNSINKHQEFIYISKNIIYLVYMTIQINQNNHKNQS